MWEHAGAGTAQRYVRLAQTRRTARTWQLNTGAAAMRTPWGPGVSIPTDNGAEIEALAGSNPNFAAWKQNEPYTIALLIKGRSGGASIKHLYRSGTSSTGDHILWLSSGATPNLRHQASGGGTVTITSSVAIVNDTTWSTIVGTWRPGRLELYVDGFSIGSNDLTQLVLGVDRDSDRLKRLFDERDEAVTATIADLLIKARHAGVKTGICGQAPSDHPEFARFLVEHGIDSISVSPDSFLAVKQHVAEAERRRSESAA